MILTTSRTGKRAPPRERGPQRLALDEGHRVIQQLAFGRPVGRRDSARRQQRDDVRVLQLSCDLDLALKSLAVHSGRELGRQHLDHDLPAERVLRGREDTTHPAAGQLVVDPVGGRQRGGESVAEGVVHSGRS